MTDTVSCLADARVFDVVASGKWLVNSPVRSPVRPAAHGFTRESQAVNPPISRWRKGAIMRRLGAEAPPGLDDLLRDYSRSGVAEGNRPTVKSDT